MLTRSSAGILRSNRERLALAALAHDNERLFLLISKADLRLVAGDFTELGTRASAESIGFIRIGTHLDAIKGDLSYLKAVFSIYFDEEKYFGINLGYARESDDLSTREQNWSFGFGAKF